MAYIPTRTYTRVGNTQVLTLEEWSPMGLYHRVDGPALRVWEIVKGVAVLTRESWWVAGDKHRVDGPALRVWSIVKGVAVLTREGWYLAGKVHRVDGPAVREWSLPESESSHCLARMWRRLTGASRVTRQPILTLEEWCVDGWRHRVDGPAFRCWKMVGQDVAVLTYECWWLKGRLHRVDGPAVRVWQVVDGVTVLTREGWRLKGRQVEPFAFLCIRLLTITRLQRCGLVVWPGLMDLIGGYLV